MYREGSKGRKRKGRKGIQAFKIYSAKFNLLTDDWFGFKRAPTETHHCNKGLYFPIESVALSNIISSTCNKQCLSPYSKTCTNIC